MKILSLNFFGFGGPWSKSWRNGEFIFFFLFDGIKIGREYIRKWVICGKTLSGLNTGVEMKSAVLSLCSASGCPAGNQIMWNTSL